jgi:hypothetical protein
MGNGERWTVDGEEGREGKGREGKGRVRSNSMAEERGGRGGDRNGSTGKGK